jgi:5'-nucleotidase
VDGASRPANLIEPAAKTSLPAEQLVLPELDLSALRPPFVPEREKRVFCNRNIRLDQIDWVGFDMDYTLAIYDQPRMDRLTINAALNKLVARGYPESLLELELELDFPVRGLMIDAKLGNVLKMDRYKYVKRAYHGMRELSYEERRETYHTTKIRAKKNPRYHFVDTLYALSEVTVFAAGVQHLESLGYALDYTKWFADIRDCVDLSHQDGSILDHIVANPAEFLVRDPDLPLALHKLRSAGKKLFLLTNSQPAYTAHLMQFLMEGSLPEYKSWKQFFDVIITAARKPRFFIEEDIPLALHEQASVAIKRLERGKIYTGGCLSELSRLTNMNGDRVLYVGDHIYGDVLRAKKHSAWRTAMIIQELELELRGVHATTDAASRWDQLEEARQALSEELRFAQTALKQLQRSALDDSAVEAERTHLKRRIERTRARIRAVESECNQLEHEIETHFHRYWGPLLKAGPEPSSFGHQVEAYSCLYTGRVSNFLGYSPVHYFRSPREQLPHEL